jgi:hypothetical protein
MLGFKKINDLSSTSSLDGKRILATTTSGDSYYYTATNLEKAAMEAQFNTGHLDVTSLTNIPTRKRLVIATVSSSSSLSFSTSPTITDGREIHIIINNNGTSAITVALPNTGNYVCMANTEITIEPGAYAELNVISDGNKKYIRGI